MNRLENAVTFSRTKDNRNETSSTAVVGDNAGKSFGDQDVRVNWIKEKVFSLWDIKRTQRLDEVKKRNANNC